MPNYIEIRKPFIGAEFTFTRVFDDYQMYWGKKGVIVEIQTNYELEDPEDEYMARMDDGKIIPVLATELGGFYAEET